MEVTTDVIDIVINDAVVQDDDLPSSLVVVRTYDRPQCNRMIMMLLISTKTFTVVGFN